MEGIVSKREDRFQNPMLHQRSIYGPPATPEAGIKVGNVRGLIAEGAVFDCAMVS